MVEKILFTLIFISENINKKYFHDLSNIMPIDYKYFYDGWCSSLGNEIMPNQLYLALI